MKNKISIVLGVVLVLLSLIHFSDSDDAGKVQCYICHGATSENKAEYDACKNPKKKDSKLDLTIEQCENGCSISKESGTVGGVKRSTIDRDCIKDKKVGCNPIILPDKGAIVENYKSKKCGCTTDLCNAGDSPMISLFALLIACVISIVNL